MEKVNGVRDVFMRCAPLTDCGASSAGLCVFVVPDRFQRTLWLKLRQTLPMAARLVCMGVCACDMRWNGVHVHIVSTSMIQTF